MPPIASSSTDDAEIEEAFYTTHDAEIEDTFYAFLDDEIDDADAARAAIDVVCRSVQDTIEKE
jgi:hypothetical protein